TPDERQPFLAPAMKKIRVVQVREKRKKRRYARVAFITTVCERSAQRRKRNVENRRKGAPGLFARTADTIAVTCSHPMRSRHVRMFRRHERCAPLGDQYATSRCIIRDFASG